MNSKNKIHLLFEEQVKFNPNKIAIKYLNEKLTYNELHIKSNKLAMVLTNHGINPGEFVIVLSSKSIDTIVSILAILKIGAAYIPLNSAIKDNMLHSILQSSQAKLILTEANLLTNLSDIKLPLICFEDYPKLLTHYKNCNIKSKNNNFDTAYAIYTSGTTGIPKGVVISHESLIYTFHSWKEVYGLKSSDIHLQIADISFDVFTGEYIRSICSGAELVICPKKIVIDIPKMHLLIKNNQINFIEFTPSVLREYMFYLDKSKIDAPKFRILIVGSDIWTIDEYIKAKEIFGKNVRLINSYGLTEATIDSSFFEKDNINDYISSSHSLVPIGKPFPHVNIYIVDDNLKQSKTNEIGEIYIGGRGIALGYLNQEKLTTENFVILDSINPKEKLYKTGDFGKILPDGNIDFIGRNQNIIKIDGQRVELLSLESILNIHPKIKQSIVVPELSNDNKYSIICFILPNDKNITFDEISEHINLNFPCYYLPQKIWLISEIIINKNGKVEKKLICKK